MTIRFACGHVLPYDERRGAVCACGERRVSSVSGDQPHFTGTVSGPLATTKALDAIAVDLAPGGALPLKPIKES